MSMDGLVPLSVLLPWSFPVQTVPWPLSISAAPQSLRQALCPSQALV